MTQIDRSTRPKLHFTLWRGVPAIVICATPWLCALLVVIWHLGQQKLCQVVNGAVQAWYYQVPIPYLLICITLSIWVIACVLAVRLGQVGRLLGSSSLVFLVVLSVGWFRSYYIEGFGIHSLWTTPGLDHKVDFGVSSVAGGIQVGIQSSNWATNGLRPGRQFSWGIRTAYTSKYPQSSEQTPRSPFHRPFGYEAQYSDSGGSIIKRKYCRVVFPYWSALLLAAAPWYFFIWRTMREYRRRRAGLCPICAYDLRGSGAVCPECGQGR